MVRPLHYLISALIRASIRTFTDAEKQVNELKHAALFGSTLASAGREDLTPEGWDCEPFCLIHWRASKGLVDSNAIGSGIESVKSKEGIQQAIQEYRRGKVKGSLQAAVYKAMQNNSLTGWKHLLEEKASIVAPGHRLPILGAFLEGTDFAHAKTVLRESGMMIIIKTWANSWYTSRRLDHEKVRLPCIFGCELHDAGNLTTEDSLEHYIKCGSSLASHC